MTMTPANDGGAVDVLAVMDRLVSDQRQAWGVPDGDLVQARAAMAELIDATAVFMRDEPAPSVDEMVDQYDRVRAALSRITGAKDQ